MAGAPSFSLAVQSDTYDAPDRRRLRRLVGASLTEAARAGWKASPVALTLRFADVDEARVLNRTYRDRDYATNVLTFPYPGDDAIEADVVVCLPVVRDEARQQRKDPVDHCAHLVVHGTLHAIGYDHEEAVGAASMESIERRTLARFRVPDPYEPR